MFEIFIYLYAVPMFFLIFIGAFNLNGLHLKSKNTDLLMPDGWLIVFAWMPIMNVLVSGAIFAWIFDKLVERLQKNG